MLTHTTLLISKMDPIKYIFVKPSLSRRIARWKMILTEYDIQYTTQQAIKVVDDYQSMHFKFPDEDIMLVTDYEEPGPDEGPEPGSRWTMIFDGASNALGNGIGIVITSPNFRGPDSFVWFSALDGTLSLKE